MIVCACSMCRLVDLLDALDEKKCIRCGASYVSLGVSSDQWLSMSAEQVNALIDSKVGNNNINRNLTKPMGSNSTKEATSEVSRASGNPNRDDSVPGGKNVIEMDVAETRDEKAYAGESEGRNKADDGINEAQSWASDESEFANNGDSKILADNAADDVAKKNKRNVGSGNIAKIIMIILRIVYIVAAIGLVVAALFRNSSSGGLLSIVSIIFAFRRILMNGYDLFGKWPVAVRRILGIILLVAAIVCIII